MNCIVFITLKCQKRKNITPIFMNDEFNVLKPSYSISREVFLPSSASELLTLNL